MKSRVVSTALSIWLAAALAPMAVAVGDPNVDSGVGSSSSRGAFGYSNSNFLQQQTTPPNSYGVYRDAYGSLRDTGMVPDNLTADVDEMVPEQHILGQTPWIPGLGAVGGIGSVGGFGGFGGGVAIPGAGLPAALNPTGLPLSQPLTNAPSFVRGFGSIPGYRGGFAPASPFGPASVSRGRNGGFQPLAPERTSRTQTTFNTGPGGNTTNSQTTGPGNEQSSTQQQQFTGSDTVVTNTQETNGLNSTQTSQSTTGDTTTGSGSGTGTTPTEPTVQDTTTTTTFGDQRGFTMTMEEQPQGNLGSNQGSRSPEPTFGTAQNSTTGGSLGSSQGTTANAPAGTRRGVVGNFGTSTGQRETPVDTSSLFSPFAFFPFSTGPFPPGFVPPFFGGGGLPFASGVINPNILMSMDERQRNQASSGTRSTGEISRGRGGTFAPQITNGGNGTVRGRPGTSVGSFSGADGISGITSFGATGTTSTAIGNGARGSATTFGPTGTTSVTFGGPTVVTSGPITTVFDAPLGGGAATPPINPFEGRGTLIGINAPPGILPSVAVQPVMPYVGGLSAAGDGLQMDMPTETDAKLKALRLRPSQMLGTIIGHMRYTNGDIITFGSKGTMRLAADNSGSITLNSGEVMTFRRAGEDLRQIAYRSLFLF